MNTCIDSSKIGARMSVSDGTLTVVAKNQAAMEKVQEKVFEILCFTVFGSVGMTFEFDSPNRNVMFVFPLY